jgi:hypothetical protein
MKRQQQQEKKAAEMEQTDRDSNENINLAE